ncbi:MAG: hypothetical protein BMS9Abin37_0259 [Acidobacteriota bacterium]|nr:MAG: hypothetical protein BMS9Abin37_0259 [Acidobacteriota bacterium]
MSGPIALQERRTQRLNCSKDLLDVPKVIERLRGTTFRVSPALYSLLLEKFTVAVELLATLEAEKLCVDRWREIVARRRSRRVA